MMWPSVLIVVGWALAFVLSRILGPITDFRWSTLVFCLSVGAAINAVAVVMA